MSQSLYVIDGHYQIFRAYYAPYQHLTAPSGEPTKATHAFCTMLFNLIKSRRPDYLAMALDVSDETVFRRDLYPEYKAHREPPPEDFAPQAQRIISLIENMGIPVLRAPGFEADDLMATIAARMADRDVEVFLVSRDKDLDQLLTDRVFLFDPFKDEVVDVARLAEKKGFTPQDAVEIQTLTGDTVDNVPGITGVGPKTALKLIKQYKTAAAVLENADKLTPKMKERVKDFADRIDITRQLVTLRSDVPIEFDLDAARFDGIPADRIRPVFQELNFKRLSDQLETVACSDTPLKEESIESAPPKSTEHNYELIDDESKLKKFAAKLAKVHAFAFDTETTGLNPVAAKLAGISISWKEGTGYYIPTRAAMGDTIPVETAVKHVKPIFENQAIAKCGHNLKFDMLVLRQVGINVAGTLFDTLIASFLLEPLGGGHGLDALARQHFDHTMIPITDIIGKGRTQTTIDQIETARVGEYASEDADYTWRLYELFNPKIRDSAQLQLFEDVEMPLSSVLVEMEHNGITLDPDLLAKMSNEMADELVALTRQIHDAAGHEFNIDSTQQLANVLFDEQGLEVVRKTKTGRSTDAATLAVLESTTDNPIPGLVLRYRELAKLKSTYVDTLPDMIDPVTNRLHGSFHQTGAVTGRLSSSNPNLQNIPIRTETGRKIRAAFISGDSKNVLLTADYSQIELRVLAHFCGDEKLAEAFQNDLDIHAFVAAQVNGVEIDKVTREQRSAAKAVNFGIIYGQTPFGLARSLAIPVAEAKAFIDTYFLRYPGIRLFIDQCIDNARRDGYVETILGRRRPIEELTSRNRQRIALGERLAVNTVIQGSAADLIKRAMVDIHKEIQSNARPSKMLIQVHDELLFEIPEEHVKAEADMIRDKMCRAIELDVPIAVDINWGRNWLEGK